MSGDPVHADGFALRLKQARRRTRKRLNQLLARWFGTSEPRRAPLADDTCRILVVRTNKRLGNILFLTPMLRTLAATLPGVRIDVLIQSAAQKPLLESMANVDRVWVQRKSLRQTLGLLRRLRARRYDLAIDPTVNSTGNRLALALVGARQRMGFAVQGQWVSLTHAAGYDRNKTHQAEQALALLEQSVAGLTWHMQRTVGVTPNDAARQAAAAHWNRAFDDPTDDAPVIAFFVYATGKKQLPEAWWQSFLACCERDAPGARLLSICPPGVRRIEPPGVAQVQITELDVLAALLARAHVFVAADSGPMHLAAAAGTPVVGLFNATSSTTYAPLGRHCTTLAGDALQPEVAAAAAIDRLQIKSESDVADPVAASPA